MLKKEIKLKTEKQFLLCSGDPWGAGDDEICRFDGNKQDVTVMVMGFETLPHNEMEPAMEHLANVGKHTVQYVHRTTTRTRMYP